MAYWSTAESIMRRSFRIRLACERLRARRNPGTAIAASNAMIATTIMISTRVKPLCDFAADVFIYIRKNSRHHAKYIEGRCLVRRSPTSSMSRLTADDYEALANFRYLLRKFLRFSKDFLKANGNLSPEQYEALLAIRAFTSIGGLTISHLSERLQVKHHSAVNIVDRLAERKLITREVVKADRRRRQVQLTAEGEKLIDELAAVHRKEIRGRSTEMIKVLERLMR